MQNGLKTRSAVSNLEDCGMTPEGLGVNLAVHLGDFAAQNSISIIPMTDIKTPRLVLGVFM
jgi:hypothetical protein